MWYETRCPRAARCLQALAAASILASCTPDPAGDTCLTNCELEIFLPENPDMPPRVPPVIRVVEDQAITVAVWGRRPAQARSVLVFDQPAVLDAEGRPQFTVELPPGQTTLHLRRYEDGVCHAPAGCGYLVVNAGLAARPAATSPTGILIIDSAATPN